MKQNGDTVEEGGSDGDSDDKAVASQCPPIEVQLVSVLATEEQALSKISNNFMFDYTSGGDDSGTEKEQAAFMKELERFYKEKMMEFKPPKFYGEGLNCLK